MSEQRIERLVRASAPQRLPVGRALSLLAVVCVLVALVAAASPRSLARTGPAPPGVDVSLALGDLVAIALALVVVGFAVLAYLAWPGRRGREEDEPELVFERQPMHRRERLLLLVLALVVVGVPLAAVALLARREEGQAPPAPVTTGGAGRPSGRPAPDAPTGRHEPLTVHWPVLVALASLALLAVAAYLLARARSRRRVTPEPDRVVRELVGAVEESLEELEREPDPRRAVIRAYARMERVLAAHGAPRRAFEAPVEYLTRALKALRAGGASAKRLTLLFERARFSRHAVDQAMKREAIDALVALRAELEAER